MEVKFNVIKEARKALVAAVSEITEVKAEYQGAPSFAFKINGHVVDKNGTMSFDERTDAADIRALLTALEERGFAYEGDIDELMLSEPVPAETVSDDDTPGEAASEVVSSAVVDGTGTPDTLVIEIPRIGFTRTAIDNLEKMVSSKADLIMKAIGVPETPADDLPIEYTESTLRFPWFPLPVSKDETDAYTKFVFALCELAKKQKRVTMRDADVDSEKFAFRCFLLRLGFKGDEYKSARRILLSKLSGNGSFKSGNHKKNTAPEAVTAADSGADNAAAISVSEGGNNTDNTPTGGECAPRLRCDQCQRHCYYTDGPLQAVTGDIVDTSKRKPDTYTHYCLGTPSGYRRIKHATEWSGLETAPTWCPLSISNKTAADNEEVAHG